MEKGSYEDDMEEILGHVDSCIYWTSEAILSLNEKSLMSPQELVSKTIKILSRYIQDNAFELITEECHE